jgi:hypothetical protein
MVTEGKLVQFKYTGSGQDGVRYPDMLTGKMGYLANAVAVADFAPADQHLQVYEQLKAKLNDVTKEWASVVNGPLNDFLKLLDDNKIKPIIRKK